MYLDVQYIFVHFAVARNHLLMQKRDSKSFDAVALHKNQLHEEDDDDDDDTAFEEKTHQSLDYSLYSTDTGNGNGGSGSNGNGAAAGIPIDGVRNIGINGNANRMDDEQSNGDICVGAVGGCEAAVSSATPSEVKRMKSLTSRFKF